MQTRMRICCRIGCSYAEECCCCMRIAWPRHDESKQIYESRSVLSAPRRARRFAVRSSVHMPAPAVQRIDVTHVICTPGVPAHDVPTQCHCFTEIEAVSRHSGVVPWSRALVRRGRDSTLRRVGSSIAPRLPPGTRHGGTGEIAAYDLRKKLVIAHRNPRNNNG